VDKGVSNDFFLNLHELNEHFLQVLVDLVILFVRVLSHFVNETECRRELLSCLIFGVGRRRHHSIILKIIVE